MALYKKGESGNPDGRPKGSENKAKKAVKEALQELLDNNIENLSIWLTKIAKDDPKAAFDLFLKINEFLMPKPARTTIDELIRYEQQKQHELISKPMTVKESAMFIKAMELAVEIPNDEALKYLYETQILGKEYKGNGHYKQLAEDYQTGKLGTIYT